MQIEFLYIYTVYEEGSFSKAAEKLFLTQPALSIAIQKVETNIGMPLFDRTRRPLQLTQAGEIYISMIKQMMDLESDLNEQIHDIQNLQTGILRIGGSHYLNSYILPKVLCSYSKAYPGIRLELVEEDSHNLSMMLKEKKLDLTFSCNPTFMEDFERYPVFYDHILLAVPAQHPINKQLADKSLSAADIVNKMHLKDNCKAVSITLFRDLDFILLSPGNNLYNRSMQIFEDAGCTPKVKMVLSQLVTAFHLAESNFAAAFVSDCLVKSTCDSLVFYKIDSELTTRLFYVLLPNRHYTSCAAKMFIQYILTQL